MSRLLIATFIGRIDIIRDDFLSLFQVVDMSLTVRFGCDHPVPKGCMESR